MTRSPRWRTVRSGPVERCLLEIERPQQDESVLAGLGVDRLDLHPRRGRADKHLPQLGPEGGGRRGGLLEKREIVELETDHSPALLSGVAPGPRLHGTTRR